MTNSQNLIQEETDALVKIFGQTTEFESLTSQKRKTPVRDDFYQTFRNKIVPILYNLFHSLEAEGIFLNSFYVTSIPLIAQPDAAITKK